MKAITNQAKRVIVDVNVNGRKVGEYKIRTDDTVDGSSAKIAAYINSKQGSDRTRELVESIERSLAGNVVGNLIWEKDAIKNILSDAFETAPSREIEESIISMQIQLLPMLKDIHNPMVNKLSKESSKQFWGFETYDQVITVILAKNFLIDGIITFNARLER